jgi:hypothetical protein
MKKILLLLLITISVSGFTQTNSEVSDSLHIEKLNDDISNAKTNVWIYAGAGIFAHLTGTFVDGKPDLTPGVVIGNIYGLAFDSLAIYNFIQLRKKKKELKKYQLDI